jgi:hypothetical protein
MALEFDCNGLLDIGIKAKLRTFNGTGLDADKIAVVYYEVPLGAGAGCIDWLKANRKTVRDAQIDFQMLSGTWRSAGIVSEQSTKNKEAVTIVQTFKYGWIQSLLSGESVDWSESRYVRGNESATPTTLGEYPVTDPALNPQQYHLVKWEGIDPLKLDAVRSELRDLTPSAWSPTVNGESLGSGFFLLDVTAETGSEQDQDRSGTITALIAKPRFSLQAWENYGTPAQAKVYYLYDVPMYLAQSIVNLYNKRTGTTASAGAPSERFLMNIQVTDRPDESTTDKHISFTSCAMWSLTTFYHNVAAMVAAPANAMGITYSARFDLIRQTGLYSGTIEKRVRQTIHTARHASVSDHDKYAETEIWNGVYVAYSDATPPVKSYKSAVLSIEPATTGEPPVVNQLAGDIKITLSPISDFAPATTVPTAGTALEWSIRQNDDCTLDCSRGIDTQRTENARGKTTTVDAFTKTVVSIASGQASGGTDITTLAGVNIKVLKWDKDRYGQYTKTETELTPVAADTGWIEYPDRYGSSYYRSFRNQTPAWLVGTTTPLVAGIVDNMDDTTSNSLSVSRNAHGLYDGVATRQAYNDGTGYGTFFRSTSYDSRLVTKEKEQEWSDNLLKTKFFRTLKATFVIVKASAIAASYANADDLLSTFWELTSADGYTGLELLKEPSAVMVSDPDGHRGIRVEAVYTKQTTDWALEPQPA